MMIDYSQAKIYKITNDYNDQVYIGSTCDTLVKRFSYHKKDRTRNRNINRPLYQLMNEIGFERFRIQLICDFPCEDKYELKQKEGEYIRTIGTLNVYIAGNIAPRDEVREKIEDRIIYKKEKIECDCGCMIRRSDISTHRKTKKHQQIMDEKIK